MKVKILTITKNVDCRVRVDDWEFYIPYAFLGKLIGENKIQVNMLFDIKSIQILGVKNYCCNLMEAVCNKEDDAKILLTNILSTFLKQAGITATNCPFCGAKL